MGIGFRELLVILVIALLIFGAKRLRTIGTDLGAAVRGFKKSMGEGEQEDPLDLGARERPAQLASNPEKPAQDAAKSKATRDAG